MDMTAIIGDSSSSAHGRGKRSARSAGERRSGEIGDLIAMPRLAQADRQATAVLVPLLDIPQAHRVWVAAAFLLDQAELYEVTGGEISKVEVFQRDTPGLIEFFNRNQPAS
jgi:hypothetical protein